MRRRGYLPLHKAFAAARPQPQSFQHPTGKKSEVTAVRRPEGRKRAVSSGQWLRGKRIERAHPQQSFGLGSYDKGQATPVRRNVWRGDKRSLLRRRDNESQRLNICRRAAEVWNHEKQSCRESNCQNTGDNPWQMPDELRPRRQRGHRGDCLSGN